MTPLRVSAIITLGLLAIYHALRLIATQCSGAQCDWFIPVSLLLPLLILLMAALTGFLAIGTSAGRGQIGWLSLFVAATGVGVLGPVVSLAIFRHSPDVFVPLATALIALIPVTTLIYSVVPKRP